MTRAKPPIVSALLLLLVAACGPPVDPAGTLGALHEGGFTYCDDPGAGCESEELPAAIAVGGTFGVSYDGGSTGLSSSDETALRTVDSAGTFLALHAGDTNVEERTTDGTLLDYVEVSLVEPSSLTFHACPDLFNAILSPEDSVTPCGDAKAGSSVAFSRGASLAPTVCAVPTDAHGNELGGSVPVEWTRSPDSVADLEIHVGLDSRCATIGGLTLGTGSLTVTTGDVRSTLDVTVKP